MIGEFSTFLYLIPLYVLLVAALWGIFEKAGEAGWKALVPIYNFWVWIKIIGKPWWWFALLFVPVINVLMFMGMVIELCKVFGKFSFLDHFLAILFPYLYFIYLGFNKKDDFIGPEAAHNMRKGYKKSAHREWADAIVFAIVAATIIRWFFIEAYTIPTSSMEKSLLVGDFLFVSKFNYGPRLPMTPLSFPFAHNTLPLTDNTKSYFEWPSFPYERFPGFEKIEREDVVVFNWPREMDRPVDKKTNYIKRCVGIPGDSLKVANTILYVNGEVLEDHEMTQYMYYVKTKDYPISEKDLLDWGVTEYFMINPRGGEYKMLLSRENLLKVKSLPQVTEVRKDIYPEGHFDVSVYPYFKPLPWNRDYFGPILIPAKGSTIKLDRKNFALYEMPIKEYEGVSSLIWKDGKAYIDGQPAEEYTFRMNYYFMMGDNRHNSLDSRMWGFVPEDHIVGKALFLWFSWDKVQKKIRFDRIFTGIN